MDLNMAETMVHHMITMVPVAQLAAAVLVSEFILIQNIVDF